MSSIFLGGLPTGPDVKALDQAYPAFNEGQTIPYEALATIIRVDVKSTRFRVVLNAWRKQLFKSRNFVTVAVSGIGIRRLPENERASDAFSGLRRGAKSIRKAVHRSETIRTEVLTEPELKTATHVRRIGEAMYSAARNSLKELASNFSPPKALPRGQ